MLEPQPQPGRVRGALHGRRAWTAVALVLALVAFAPGCERITGPSELEREIAAAQKVIAKYSAEVEAVDALQQQFVEAWQKANELKEVKAFRDAVEAQVIPRLESYVDALGAMPADAELSKVHGILVDAYGGTEQAFRAFIDGLDEESIEARYKVLLETMDEVAKAEERYRKELETFYSRNRVRLVEP